MSVILGEKKYQEYVYDFAEDAATGVVVLSDKATKNALPVGAIVTGVALKVLTAFASGTSMSWGNGDDADGYSGTAIVTASLTLNALFNGWDNAAALLWDDTNDHAIYNNVADAADGSVSVTIAGTMTAGKAVLMVEYLMPAAS